MATKTKTSRDTNPKADNSNRPWVSNYPPLAVWLEKHEARCMWQLPLGGEPDEPTAYVEHYMIVKGNKASLFVVVVHANGHGWEIYTPCDSNMITETLEDAEKRLGLEGEVK